MSKFKLKRIAVKVGSNVLTRKDGTLDVTQMSSLVDQLAVLHKAGIEIILVSSGAVAAGRSELHPVQKIDSVEQRQLFSAIGQAKLINRYYELFREHHIVVGQVLTMKENFSTRRHYLNQKSCMSVMLQNNVIPIVNENDTVSITELMFTDNDELSGLIAAMMDAQALIILSNIDGIYNGDPSAPGTSVIRRIAPEDDISSFIQAGKSSFGRGGMMTKTNIARKVADEGIEVIIANGRTPGILERLVECPDNTVCTRFLPANQPVSSVKKWIAHSESFAKGEIYVNQPTSEVLLSNKVTSLLPIGISDVKGEFEKDDIVKIMNHEGDNIGVGRVSYGADKVRSLMGKHGQRPVIHYDYLYIE